MPKKTYGYKCETKKSYQYQTKAKNADATYEISVCKRKPSNTKQIAIRLKAKKY